MASLLACSASAETTGSGARAGWSTLGITAETVGAGAAGRGFLIGAVRGLAAVFGLAMNFSSALCRLDFEARTRFLCFGFRLKGLTVRMVDTHRPYANRARLSKGQNDAAVSDETPNAVYLHFTLKQNWRRSPALLVMVTTSRVSPA